jgi:hypothetical protein
MPPWLVEGDLTVYCLLALGLIVSLAGWWRTRKRGFAIAAGVFAALIVAYFLLDRFVESDGEQMTRKVSEVAAAVSRSDMEAAFTHVSDNFDRAGYDKKQFRSFCERHRAAGHVSDVKVWDLEATKVSKPEGRGVVQIHFKVTGSWGESPPNWFARVTFVLDRDGQWRVKTFDVYDALNQSNTPIGIQGWGGR